ncbi:GMP synthase-like glutamine amidotransferase [Gemmobacter caeni]|uniref:GMP synthase-like glutamine amidotransferase n=1 Tax=Gemmobacter caeni TaxID=589035 RepID=A0A2T6AVW1_9RHOB|nr:type 1 glutamine amidotransferase [Gemmobacter caeni]PTX47950.1 GMP synthase-like glutamine amidotransferase [Gemmobacter caeni]TWI97328.1 GMP synthase-like glutamine amidotransferase [Gemmobacter caeni]
MRIGILQTGFAPDALAPQMGDYPDMFARLLDGNGFDFRTYRVVDMEFPANVHDCDGWLITGSRHGAYEDHPFIKPLEDFIRRAYAEHVPMVGICFGHQIIAQALGGKVERFGGGWAVGPTDYAFGDETLTLNAWHRDQVVERPEGAEVIGSNAFCENAALVYDDRALTVQAHPEFRDEFVDGLMKTRGKGVVPDEVMARAGARLGTPIHDQTIARRIAAFFKAPRGEN